jgi:hypothetical protein
MPQADYYALLGLNNGASLEEIKQAYKARVRIIHPDRFNQTEQPKDWESANEMLAELNEAYAILKEPHLRKEYDLKRGEVRPNQAKATNQLPFLKKGSQSFSALSDTLKLKILEFQSENNSNVFKKKEDALVGNFFWLILALSWFVFIGLMYQGQKWDTSALVFYEACTAIASITSFYSVIKIIRWKKSKIKPYFYITPLYFIKTNFENVIFKSISSLVDIKSTHNYKNNVHQSSLVQLIFEDEEWQLTFNSELLASSCLGFIGQRKSIWTAELLKSNHSFFEENNLFASVLPQKSMQSTLINKHIVFYGYIVSILLSLTVVLFLSKLNAELDTQRVEAELAAQIKEENDLKSKEQPLPKSGMIKNYTNGRLRAPFEIIASDDSNYFVKLIDAKTHKLAMTFFLRKGAKLQAKVPLRAFELRYTSGGNWYGEELHFYNDEYYKTDETFTFTRKGNKILGYTVTLYTVANGNLDTDPINKADF